MAKIVECVPNISEGKDTNVINAIVDEIKKFKVRLLDVESDREPDCCDSQTG